MECFIHICRYWRPTLPGAAGYNFVEAAVTAGYCLEL